MNKTMPGISLDEIKLYHIVHVDKLPSIVGQQYLLSDSEVRARGLLGTTIGMSRIKERRLNTHLTSHPEIAVGGCVPFYFCPRNPMLYMFNRNNHPDIEYRGGQEPIVHLVLDMERAIRWARANRLRWAFTDSNAGSSYFNDYCDIDDLDKLDWDAIHATDWRGRQDRKMAEFLLENAVHWNLVDEIAVHSFEYLQAVVQILEQSEHRPPVTVKRHWYY